MGIVDSRAEQSGICSRSPARVHEDIGGGLITHFQDVGVKKWAAHKTPQESPFPETTYTYGKQVQAGTGTGTFLLGVNGNLHSATHGNPIPYDFTLMWFACRVIPVVGVQFTYELQFYNGGALVYTSTLSTGAPEYAFAGEHMDKGSLSIRLAVTAVFPGISAFTNPIVTVGIRRRF